MLTMLFFIFSFNTCNPYLEFDNNCNYITISEKAQKVKSANTAILAYAEFQILHLQQLADLLDGFLSSGHTTGSNIKDYKMASESLKQGIRELNTTKSQITKMTIKDVDTYTVTLVKIHDLGKKYFDKATKLIGLKKNGQKEFTANSDVKIIRECLGVGSSMKTACLNGIQKMADCGIYTVLGLTRMLDDQEKCDGKAAAAMQLCSQTEGAYDGYYDKSDEIMKAESACHEHAKIVGGGSQLQTQTWDGF